MLVMIPPKKQHSSAALPATDVLQRWTLCLMVTIPKIKNILLLLFFRCQCFVYLQAIQANQNEFCKNDI